MQRRTLLAGIAAGLTGCVGRAAGPGGDGIGPEDDPGETPTTTDERRVSVAGVDAVPDGHDVAIDVELLDGTVDADGTARLRVTTTNEGRTRTLPVTEGTCCLFNRSLGGSDPAGAWLHRPAAADGIDREPGRWARDAPADRRRVYAAYACIGREFASGESVSNEYLVWDDYRVEGYLEPGTYRWERAVGVGDPGGEGCREAPSAEFTWGFDLAVERP